MHARVNRHTRKRATRFVSLQARDLSHLICACPEMGAHKTSDRIQSIVYILRRSAFFTFVYAHAHTCMHAAESTYARAQAWQQQQEKAEGAAEQSDKLKEGWRVLVQGRRMGSRGVTSVSA